MVIANAGPWWGSGVLALVGVGMTLLFSLRSEMRRNQREDRLRHEEFERLRRKRFESERRELYAHFLTLAEAIAGATFVPLASHQRFEYAQRASDAISLMKIDSPAALADAAGALLGAAFLVGERHEGDNAAAVQQFIDATNTYFVCCREALT